MKAIVTVVGSDTVGIIAAVTTELANNKINVLDISQTVLQGYFTMTMVVDISAMTVDFTEMTDRLKTLGTGMGLDIRMQKASIFRAMHRI